MRINIYFIFLIFLTSCSSEQFTLEQYQNYPVKFMKKSVVYPDETFELLLPNNWDWKVENYEDTEEIILGIDAVSTPDERQFINVISIQKVKAISDKKDLESEYKMILERQQKNSYLKLFDSGKSKLLDDESYFFHLKSNTEKYGEVEMITLITKSKSDENFYHLTASTSRTNELKMNMAMMIQCLKTFKQNKKK